MGRRVSTPVVLAATAIVIYLVLVFGSLHAGNTGGSLIGAVHHVVAGLGGGLVCWSLYRVRSSAETRVQVVMALATLAYPIQAIVGWRLVAGADGLAGLHLGLAMGIFGAVLLGVIWAYADGTGIENDAPSGSTEFSRVYSGWSGRVRAYVALTKPRLLWLLSLLAVGGIALAGLAGATVAGSVVVATVTGGSLAVGASATFNHVYERDRDSRMDRTADRPVATASVSAGRALAFGVGLLTIGLGTLWLFTTPVATLLTGVAVVYYSVIYTVILKPHTTWNITIGGGSGALPALIGWTAVTGSIGWPAVVLALLVVCWTPGHFYNLAIAYRDDYARGGYPMLPVVRGLAVTRRRIGYSLGVSLVLAAWLGVVTGLGGGYAIAVTIGGAVFIGAYVRQVIAPDRTWTLRTFHASNAFLGFVLVGIVIEFGSSLL